MIDISHASAPKKILVIEDDAVQRQVLTEKFSAAGFHILEATDGAQGLKKALSNFPDIILLDNRMPTMGGYEMLTRLRKENTWGETVPVIFFSNVEPGSKAEWDDISASGASQYLVKSETSLDEVVLKVKEILKI